MSDLEYDAILIDTSIFDGNALKLESGLLGKLNQFLDSPVDFLMPDVICREIESHLDKKISISRHALEKSLNDASDHLFFDGSILNDAKNLIVSSNEVEGLAKSRLDLFLNKTGALRIDCDEYISVKELLGSYFENKPPFSESGKKKNEFPDAIVLLAVESWADDNQKNVLAVAKDKDWKAYCEGSDRIDYIEDFSEGLSKFNTATAPYVFLSNLKSALEKDLAKDFLSNVKLNLGASVEGFTPDQIADSSLQWEAEGAYGSLKDIDLKNYDFRVIDTDEDFVVIEVLANITVEVEGEFSLSVYDSIDREYINMGGIVSTIETAFESEILITISGDLNGEVNDVNIEEVEVVDFITSVDFGTLEFESDYYI